MAGPDGSGDAEGAAPTGVVGLPAIPVFLLGTRRGRAASNEDQIIRRFRRF